MSARVSAGSRFAVRFIQTYRAVAKQHGLGGGCRFEPSCSAYGLEAFRRYGFWRAAGKTIRRIRRCRPGYAGPLVDPP